MDDVLVVVHDVLPPTTMHYQHTILPWVWMVVLVGMY
jgi:hypothetical protein